MIGCDKCERWYHGPCVGVGKSAADSMDDYLCPLCATQLDVPYSFGPPVPQPKLTRRPKLKFASALLAEADEIGVETCEAELIRQMVRRSTEWQAKAKVLLAALQNDGSCSSEEEGAFKHSGGGGQELAALLPSNAEAFLHEGEACEVEPEALNAVRKHALRLSMWHTRARAVLDGEYDVDCPFGEQEPDSEGLSPHSSSSFMGSANATSANAYAGTILGTSGIVSDLDDRNRVESNGAPLIASPGDATMALQCRLQPLESLAVDDVLWMSRDHIRSILRKEGVVCKTSKADMQAQVLELIQGAQASMLSSSSHAPIRNADAGANNASAPCNDAGASYCNAAPLRCPAGEAEAAVGKARAHVFSVEQRPSDVQMLVRAASAQRVSETATAELARSDKVDLKRARGDRESGSDLPDNRKSGRDRDKAIAASSSSVAGAGPADVPPNSLAGVQILLQEAEQLGIGPGCVELSDLRCLLARAYDWQVAARRALTEDRHVGEAELDMLLDELSQLPIRLQERTMLKHKLASKRWLLSRRDTLIKHLQGRPELSELKMLADEATQLGLARLEEVKQAQRLVTSAHAWACEVATALGGSATLEEMKKLHEQGNELPVAMPEQAQLAQRIEDTAHWSDRAHTAVSGSITHQALLAVIERAPIWSMPPAQLTRVVAREHLVQWWLRRANAAFVKDGCSLSMLECLRGDGRYELVGPDGHWCATLACTFCTGEDPQVTSQFMIGCDKCERWYHGPCVGVGKSAADSMDDYLCPLCATQLDVPYSFGPPVPQPKLTRRPKLKFASALLAEADEIGVETCEAELIRQMVRRSTEWQAKAKDLLSNAAKDGPDAWASLVQHVLQEGTALEIEPEFLACVRQAAARLGDWVTAATSLGAPMSFSFAESDASGANGAWDNLEDASLLLGQSSWLPLHSNHLNLMNLSTKQAYDWRHVVRRQTLLHSRASSSSATANTSLMCELRTLAEGRPSIQVLPEAEELRLALSRHGFVGSL